VADRHPGEDLLIDLAVSDVDGRARADLTEHLDSCPACRERYAAFAAGVDHVLAAAPRVTPPADLAPSVLLALEAKDPDVATARPESGPGARQPGGRRPLSARRREGGRRGAEDRPGRRAAWTAAVAALGLALGAVVTVVVTENQGPETSAGVAASGAALRTPDGVPVGTVLEGRYSGQAVFVVSVAGGRAGVRYDCELLLADGTRRPAGSWRLDESAEATWVVPRPEGAAVVGVELMTGPGRTWAAAQL
jgi:hypothetical protein